MRDKGRQSGWASAVDKILRGDPIGRPLVILGPTPELLQKHGLSSSALSITVGKLARCRREHSEVSRQIWHDLPKLLNRPLAIFPSSHDDGSIVVMLLVEDRDGSPVLVAISPGKKGLNTILSVYGKQNGYVWAAAQIERARKDGVKIFESKGFAASLPQPPIAKKAISSSHDLISSNGTAKPARKILTIGKKSTNE